MEIIKYLICWIKARYVLLSSESFCALCNAFVSGRHAKIAKYVLATYFSHHALPKDQLDRVYRGKLELKWLYLENIRHRRQLTDYEQHLLVTAMPMVGPYGFPSVLCKAALQELFEQAPAQKVGRYVCDFSLPPDYELRLIDLFNKETQPHHLNSYRRALTDYLTHAKGVKMATPDLQLAVLALDDDELTMALVDNCTLSRNILFEQTLCILVEQGSLAVLQKLLFNSFIPSEKLAQKMLQRFPQLERAYDISCLRRPLYALEQKSGQFWGTAAPTMDEHQFIIELIDTEINLPSRKDFIKKRLLSRLSDPRTTPYFCAWIASNFPEISESAYQRVRQTAKFYRDRYKK